MDAPLSGNEFENYVSASADPPNDAPLTASATLSVAEELEEEAEADQEEAIFLALATLRCAQDAEYQATDAWPSFFPHLSAHPCTGPPIL